VVTPTDREEDGKKLKENRYPLNRKVRGIFLFRISALKSDFVFWWCLLDKTARFELAKELPH